MKRNKKTIAFILALVVTTHAYSMQTSKTVLQKIGKDVYTKIQQNKGVIGLTAGALVAGYYLYRQYTQPAAVEAPREETVSLQTPAPTVPTSTITVPVDESQFAGVGLDISHISDSSSSAASSNYQSAISTPVEGNDTPTLDIAALQARLEGLKNDRAEGADGATRNTNLREQ